MNVFISWSGERSKTIAEALYEWIPNVIQAVDPWLSSWDIYKGVPWITRIASVLKKTRVGIICLTSDNLESPWIFFEAGALSKTLKETFVCPYLFDVKTEHIKEPLAHLQATKAQKEDTRKLMRTINKALGSKGIRGIQLEKAFDRWWPDLEQALEKIQRIPSPHDSNTQDPVTLQDCAQDMSHELANVGADDEVVINTIGINLEHAWDYVRGILEKMQLKNIKIRVLMLPEDPKEIIMHPDYSVPSSIVTWCKSTEARIKEVETYLKNHKKQMQEKGLQLKVEIKQYKLLPIVHGLSISGALQVHYVSFCTWVPDDHDAKEWKYDWGEDKYHICKANTNEASRQNLSSIFDGHFEYLWSKSGKARSLFSLTRK